MPVMATPSHENGPDCAQDAKVHLRAELCQGPADIATLDLPGDSGGAGGWGAQCVFVGRTRHETHEQFGRLLRLEYEVYGPMAKRTLTAIAQETARRFGCGVVDVVHAHGPVEPGQASVVIQVACPHRGEAFDACRHLIERIKRELPIWKRQIWQRGQTFNEGCCAQPKQNF